MARVLKGVEAGAAVGVDELGRYLSPGQRALLIDRLSADVEARAAAALAEARTEAAEVLADAQGTAEAIRARAYREGFAVGEADGRARGRAEAMAEVERLTALVRGAAAAADQVRGALLAGAEAQVVELALMVARRVVGAAAAEHTGIAARLVREGIRNSGGRLLRVRVNPRDVEAVRATVLTAGDDATIVADDGVTIGGCVIDVEGGTIDLRLETQLDLIERAILADADPAAPLPLPREETGSIRAA